MIAPMSPNADRLPYLTGQDHQDILAAENLIQGVILRHDTGMTLATSATLHQAIHQLHIAERRMQGGW